MLRKILNEVYALTQKASVTLPFAFPKYFEVRTGCFLWKGGKTCFEVNTDTNLTSGCKIWSILLGSLVLHNRSIQ